MYFLILRKIKHGCTAKFIRHCTIMTDSANHPTLVLTSSDMGFNSENAGSIIEMSNTANSFISSSLFLNGSLNGFATPIYSIYNSDETMKIDTQSEGAHPRNSKERQKSSLLNTKRG
ncbi:hypothetical protein FGO68_gene13512 [Halteria grandinella]|uniref:Uncharacterized protein n=1 Tax=Halteria grandinella TaxID=5974 RepID=A0A8J8NGV4_HALGN|nr:hypothetical protein FGO68_gene13512 [Halteria grandinella]